MTHTLLDEIGNTPLVEIRHLNPNPAVRVLAKLEYMNPGGSIKDRAALYMITAGEASGELTPQKTVIEATSGNTGIGLALVCAVKGYRLLLAMSESASIERQKILRARGAEILLTPGHLGTDGAIEEVYRLVRENPDQYFMTDQYNNPANILAHQEGTAREIWEQTGGRVTHVVAALGTCGTVMGLSMGLKAFNPALRVIAVEPYMGHKIQGLKNLKESYCPEIFDKQRIDEKVNIDDEEAFEVTRRLARREGLFVGMSSGAAMAAALRQASALSSGVVAVILPDGGERYLSTPLFTAPERADIRLFDTMHREKRPLETLQPGKASVYTCGPTAYARLHLAQCRRYVFADLLCRYLRYRGYEVRHLVNITDLDDRTIQGSEKAGRTIEAFTREHIDRFKEDMAYLRIQPADHYPLASEHVDDMVQLARQLVQKGFAYEKLRSLYFDISRLPAYGRLSGIDLDKIRLGHTVDLDEYEKDNPRDFTLLKRARLSELKRGLFIRTEWGNVRPSWHIQCVAMATKYLGESIDIHTGGRELVFPHHENEIAIAAAASGKPLARVWLHCDGVHPEDRAGDDPVEQVTMADLARGGFAGRTVRFWLLATHYRKSASFSKTRLLQAEQSLRRLDTCIRKLQEVRGGEGYPECDQLLYDIRNGFTQAMDDDLNVSGALAAIFSIVRRVNRLNQAGRLSRADADRLLEGFRQVDRVLDLFDFNPSRLPQEVTAMLAAREAARAARDWPTADRIREELRARGIAVEDRT